MTKMEIKQVALAMVLAFVRDEVKDCSLEGLQEDLRGENNDEYLKEVDPSGRTKLEGFTIASIVEAVQDGFSESGFDAVGFDAVDEEALRLAKELLET